MTSRYQLFVRKWGKGCDSSQCKNANHVCLARGSVPCDILFIAESPGESEDTLGRPLCGPSGRMIDHVVQQGLRGSSHPNATTAFTNLVGCIPRDEQEGGKATEPDVDQILQCQPRLEEFIRLCSPKLIVAVGSLSRDWLKQGFKDCVQVPDGTLITDIIHPAAILRANVANQAFLVQRAIVILSDAITEALSTESKPNGATPAKPLFRTLKDKTKKR